MDSFYLCINIILAREVWLSKHFPLFLMQILGVLVNEVEYCWNFRRCFFYAVLFTQAEV